MLTGMNEYEVTLYYHSHITVKVVAENDAEAVANAYLEAGKGAYDAQLLHNVQSDGEPDVECISREDKC